MKIRVVVEQGYNKNGYVFRGWATARDWILEALMAGDEGTEITISLAEPLEPVLTTDNPDFAQE